MNNTVSLILFISILILTIKYISELKYDKYLLSVLILFAIACIGFIMNFFFDQPGLLSIGIISGMIMAPIVFSIKLLIQKKDKNEKAIRILMLFPAFGLLIHWLFKIMHMPGYATINLTMIIPITVGFFIIFNKKQIDETKPLQLILIFLVIDLLTFFMN